MSTIKVVVANVSHLRYVNDILVTIEESAKQRGTGIARRRPEYIEAKILEGKAVIALNNDDFAGFCYIESWGHGKFVANSGLIVKPELRGQGVAKVIKNATFQLSRTRFPEAKIFGLTTGLAVMKINTSLGYRPVTFSELTDDEAFWDGCKSCVNYDILQRTNRKHCLCTGMLYNPAWETASKNSSKPSHQMQHSLAVYGRWFRYKQLVLTKFRRKRSTTTKEKETVNAA